MSTRLYGAQKVESATVTQHVVMHRMCSNLAASFPVRGRGPKSTLHTRKCVANIAAPSQMDSPVILSELLRRPDEADPIANLVYEFLEDDKILGHLEQCCYYFQLVVDDMLQEPACWAGKECVGCFAAEDVPGSVTGSAEM